LKSLAGFNNDSTHDQRIYIKNRSLSNSELSSEASELSSVNDLRSFIESLPKLADLICYCLNPNHFHLLLRQIVDDGISKFMHKLSIGYTNYFNLKNARSGALFQGPFKAVQIDSEEHFFWVSAYVNGNAQIHGLVADASKYEWCSYPEYLGVTDSALCNKGIILNQYEDLEKFKKASEDCFRQMKERKDLQKYILD